MTSEPPDQKVEARTEHRPGERVLAGPVPLLYVRPTLTARGGGIDAGEGQEVDHLEVAGDPAASASEASAASRGSTRR